MRCVKLLLMGGIVLALVAPASAITITMNLRNFDDGTLYNVNDGTYGSSQPDPTVLDALTQISPTGGLINGVQSDTWGIIRVENIETPGGGYLYQGGENAEITAIFWGMQDTYLEQVTSTGVVTQDIHGVGMQIAFFYDTTPDWVAANAVGPLGWSTALGLGGLDRPEYAGITDGELIWTMRSTTGWSLDFLMEEFFAQFNAAGATYASSGNMLLNIGPVDGWGTGSQNWTLDTDTILGYQTGDTVFSPTKTVDILIAFDGTDTNSGLWLLRTTDPIEGDMVPEPLTMAGLMLGIGSLVGYIRRRR